MNFLSRFMYILIAPRLPSLLPEDVAVIAEYYDRLARHHEVNLGPQGVWRGRISMRLAVGVRSLKAEERVPLKILRRVRRVLRRAPLGNKWRIVLQR
jgi:hypothetical protein